METLKAIDKRCSLKDKLSGRDIEPDKINKVIDAGRLAPSARNMQPWRFIVVRGKRAVESLVKAAFSEANLVVREAPVVLIMCARPTDSVIRDGKEYYLFDSGLAVENMLLAATDLGLVTHIMTGFDESALKKLLKIPGDVRVVAATPLAYPKEGNYDDAARTRLSQRTRKTPGELVYFDEWTEREPA